jgi:metal-sulfur cluster biosynthetic enzyme
MRADVVRCVGLVNDPELGADLVSLGLLYGVAIRGTVCEILLTLTYPGCPLIAYFEASVRKSVLDGTSFKDVRIQFVFDPPWSPGMMLPDLAIAYGLPVEGTASAKKPGTW